MNLTLSNWFDVIKNCSVDNTYKMGWVSGNEFSVEVGG